MTTVTPANSEAAQAYKALAHGYDTLTRGYAYDCWLSALERLALDQGLTGTRLLDIACGTGQSFMPLRSRGYQVTGCDISADMLACARSKAPEVPLHLVDMRD